jgi:hypothetical protein
MGTKEDGGKVEQCGGKQLGPRRMVKVFRQPERDVCTSDARFELDMVSLFCNGIKEVLEWKNRQICPAILRIIAEA